MLTRYVIIIMQEGNKQWRVELKNRNLPITTTLPKDGDAMEEVNDIG